MDPQRLSAFARKHLLTITLPLVVAIFVLCWLWSVGWAVGGLYVLPVALVALWSPSRQYFPIVVTATLATVGLTVTFFISPHWTNKLIALTCYILPLFTIWTVSALSLLRKWVQQAAQTSRTFSVCAACRRIEGPEGWSPDLFLQQPPGTLLRLDLCPTCTPKFGVDFQGRGTDSTGRPMRMPNLVLPNRPTAPKRVRPTA